MTIGVKLQFLRKQAGMSQETLAGQMAVSRQAVSRWELDISLPETENIIKLAKLFNVSFDYLLDENITEINEINQNQPDTAKHSKPTSFYIFTIIGGVCAYFGIKFFVVLLPLLPASLPQIISSIISGKPLSDLLPTAYAYAVTAYTPIILLCGAISAICFYMAYKVQKKDKNQ